MWKKTTPRSAPSSSGSVTKQPYMSAWPRGSLTSSCRTVVEPLGGVAPLGEDRVAAQRVGTGRDDAERLAAGVVIHRRDLEHAQTFARQVLSVAMELTFVSEDLPDDEAFDAYSQAVMRVAERLSPSVASLRARGGGGSAVRDHAGRLPAHVGARRRSGSRRVRATFTDGRELEAEVIGTDPLSDLAVLRARRRRARPGRRSATRRSSASGSSSSRSATRTASPARSPRASSRRSAARCRRAPARRRASSTT